MLRTLFEKFFLSLRPAGPEFSPAMFELPAFADWLKTQPENKPYAYEDPSECALAQYLSGKGFAFVAVGTDTVSLGNNRSLSRHALPRVLNDIVRADPTTFGAALQRTEKQLIDA